MSKSIFSAAWATTMSLLRFGWRAWVWPRSPNCRRRPAAATTFSRGDLVDQSSTVIG